MASFMPAAWSPWAMDQAIERLLATPKTTALRPCRSEDMDGSWEGERITGEEKSQKSKSQIRRSECSEWRRLRRGVGGRRGGALPWSSAFSPLVSHLSLSSTSWTSSAAAVGTGQLAATKERPYTQARMAKAATRLTLCATAPTLSARTSCRKV